MRAQGLGVLVTSKSIAFLIIHGQMDPWFFSLLIVSRVRISQRHNFLLIQLRRSESREILCIGGFDA